MTYLQQVAQGQRRRRWPLVAGIAAGVLVLIAGTVAVTVWALPETSPILAANVGHASDPPTSAAPAIAAATSAAATSASDPATDPDGQQACDKIAAWSKDHTAAAYNAAVLRPIGEQAARSTNRGIRAAGGMLAQRSKLAVAAKGGESEFSTRMDMGTAGIELSTACLNEGYTKA